MKAAYVVIFTSMLAFPLTLAMADRFGSRQCPPGLPCLPRDLGLSPAQQRALEGIYERSRRQQQDLHRQTERAVLGVLTPAQVERLRTRGREPAVAGAAATASAAP